MSMIEYRLEIADARAHSFGFALTLPEPDGPLVLSLPVWIPGSYLVREFSKHLFALEARQAQRKLGVRQLDKHRWVVESVVGAGAVTVQWRIHAFDTSVRTAYLDQRRGFFNGTSGLLRVEGRTEEPLRLVVSPPADRSLERWQLATALAAVQTDERGFGTFEAENYDALVDAPLEFGDFWRGRFRAHGVPHEFIVAGAPETFDGRRLMADARKICETEIAFWHKDDRGRVGKPPFKRYVFLLNAVDDAYGGLEHRASTALICNRRDLPRQGEPVAASELREGYRTLLGLISHEYFHAWNVKRLKPRAFAPYDYDQENYTDLLWFFEGMTSYYDDLLLLRAGLVDETGYLALLARNLNSVLAMPGQLLQSVAEASFDAWVKFYRVDENTPNATVSYYTKGALVALCLDLTLRAEGEGTLDAVMRRLWNASAGGPIEEHDIAEALQAVGGRSFARELRAWVHGRKDLPVSGVLRKVGIALRREVATIAQRLGVRVGEGTTLRNVLSGSAAESAGLAPGDELIAVDGWRLKTLEEWPNYVSEGKAAHLLAARDRQLLTLRAFLAPMAGTIKLERMKPLKKLASKGWPQA